MNEGKVDGKRNVVALVTPFTIESDVDEKKILELLLSEGVRGVIR